MSMSLLWSIHFFLTKKLSKLIHFSLKNIHYTYILYLFQFFRYYFLLFDVLTILFPIRSFVLFCLLFIIGFKTHLLTLVMIVKKDLLEWFAVLYFLNIAVILMLVMKYCSPDHLLYITVILRDRELENMCLICVHR